MLSQGSEQVYWLAAVFELLTEITTAFNAQNTQSRDVKTLKPSKMNRFQRSLVKDRVSAVAKDSTTNVATFLHNFLDVAKQYLQTHSQGDQNWKAQKSAFSCLIRYWWDTFNLATSPDFEEATFQAHLAIGTELLPRLQQNEIPAAPHDQVISTLIKCLARDFSAGFQLTTGLSMEIMWKSLRPRLVSSRAALERLAQMEQLSKRFDVLKWKLSISVSELSTIKMSLVKAYQLMLAGVDGGDLIKNITIEMQKLESVMGMDEDVVMPFLSSQFEALRQYRMMEIIRCGRHENVNGEIAVLANHPTVSEMRLVSASETLWPLQAIDYLLGATGNLEPIVGTLASQILKKMNNLGDVDLKSLKLLEAELPIMGEKLSLSTSTICQDQIRDLNSILSTLIFGVLALNGCMAQSSAANCVAQPHASINLGNPSFLNDDDKSRVQYNFKTMDPQAHIHKVLQENFNPALLDIGRSQSLEGSDKLEFLSLAWIHFAVGCLKLYVPDRAFDPDKRQRLERQRHEDARVGLEKKLASLKQFELLFSGQKSNLRCELLEEEISELGAVPQISQDIYRPAVSEMDKLQGEFSNLLKTLISSDIASVASQFFESREDGPLQQIKLTQNNVAQIIRRLSDRFSGYRDLTVPVVNMLRSLQVGLSLASLCCSKPSPRHEAALALSKTTPFLGGAPVVLDEEMPFTQPIDTLKLIATTVAIEKLTSFLPDSRGTLLKAFHDCYNEWADRLELDRVEAESKTGLYRFRGSAEDEDEDDQKQFNELFPAYENEEDSSDTPARAAPSTIVRDISVEVTKVHAEIFLVGETPLESLLRLVRSASRRIGELHDSEASLNIQSMTPALLPGALLVLSDQVDALSPSAVVPDSYNFYTDANLPESRKLVALIHRIQSRFRELQAVDEIGHMQPLEDVLVSCRELLQFRHTDPLAKIITKVEKVHTFMHEWQFGGWASRANSALAQYDDLTATIVNWRRLELSTWAKLFEMETKQCDNDARSWFFIAYRVVIAAPLQISESAPDELQDYAQNLLKDLEMYFSSAVLGQFVQRLQLLKQLSKHLELICLDLPALGRIYTALSNFISLYSRYEKPVQDSLKRGRISLEKSMKDVLLMASWKDTNIVALRDSAKRSHHKLFKIVRKFRDLLSQPMDSVLKGGLPDEASIDSASAAYDVPALFPSVDLSALALCASSVPNWSQKSKRFINISKTVSMMVDAGSVPKNAVESASYLDSFLGNIITSTAELQKATPSIVSDDNKDAVRHLKSLKRKLFADTLKEVRQMGVSFNLGANALAKQESLSTVLASVGTVPADAIDGLEYYFHKSVDLAPRFREAVRQHSGDLSSAEVARSTGFLEGILQAVITQRNTLSTFVASAKQLETLLEMTRGIWAPSKYGIKIREFSSSHEKVLRWLPNILSTGLKLVKVHSVLGKIESGDVQDSFLSWQDRFRDLARRWDKLATLPDGIYSTDRIILLKETDGATNQLKEYILDMSMKRRDIAFILNQILPWLEITVSKSITHSKTTNISDLDQKLSKICDSILVAIEKHKKAISELPASTEEPSWLVKNESCLADSIKVLYIGSIAQQIEEAFDVLRKLELSDSSTSKTAAAQFAVALPIFQQYLNTLQAAIMRYGKLHRATCKMSYILSETFIQIATQGFCTPSEKSSGQDGQTEKLEGGTGLGDGEGAEDISKDIQEDEDLDELAQEPNTEKGEMEDEKDAVDMADGEMEGEMGDAEEKGDDEEGSGDESGEENEMDEEAGDVDDLDPTAVDEKMWDGDGEQAEKDQEGDESKGKQDKAEQAAAQENGKEAPEGEDGDEGEEEEELAGAEQGEEIKQDEVEKHDPHAQEGEALDLPEDMELDGNEEDGSEAGSDDGMDDLSDVEDSKEGEEEVNDGKEESEVENKDIQDNEDIVSEMDIIDLDNDPEGEGDKTDDAGEKIDQEPEEKQPEDNDEGLLRDRNDEASADADNAVPSDVQGVGEDQDENSTDDKTESASKAQRDDGGSGGDSSEKKDSAAADGEKGRQANGDAPQDSQDDTQDSADAQPFKKLGDALEKWHRQQTKIREASDPQEQQGQDQNMDMNAENSEFQHLQDDEAEADTQALGTATEEQAHALDDSMAVDSESKEMPESFQPDEVEDNEITHDDFMDLEEESGREKEISDAYEGRAGAMIKQANPDLNVDPSETHAHAQDLEDDVEEVDTRLELTHIDPSLGSKMSAAEARSQWEHLSALTRPLSLSLTEQLRLILSPTLATKMRGDFRTGKRLNIKRIIPYIASSFKRDKIWMRRSVPSKRSYQILLAVDDSKSMTESGSGALALETLVMVSKSLSMLEVGEICVVGFGEDVLVAHDFSTPFSEDAGPALLQNFTFTQDNTNITTLINSSISLLRSARQHASSSPADLWQLQLIISDGVTPAASHSDIRRLLREAMEERIMIVFVVVDDVSQKGKGESVMDLRQVQFVDGKVKIERYLDTFPFQYYVVVGDVKELPGVLATLLRQWFAEVVDSSA